MTAPEVVKRVLGPMAKAYHPEAEVIAPLMVWDDTDGLMGVQIKAPKIMKNKVKETLCEITASFTLTPQEYRNETAIRTKGAAAMTAIKLGIMSQIKLAKPKAPEAGEA